MIGGQSEHPVQTYLDAWYRMALRGTAALAAIAGLASLAFLKRYEIGRALAGVSERTAQLRDRDVFTLAVAFGVVFGVLEAVRAVVWYAIRHRAGGEVVAPEVYWMAPTSAAAFLVVIGTLLVWGRRVLGRSLIADLAPVGFAVVCVFSFGRSLALGLHPAAISVLAVGAAVLVGRSVSRWPEPWFRWARRIAWAGIVALTLWALWVPPSRRLAERRATRDLPTAAADAPNVLLVVWDTVRALSLSVYGYERETTPTLDRMAAASVVFERAASSASWTLPAHASLFTGRYHHEHSATRSSPLDDEFPTLAEALSGRGYRTAGFAANTYWVGRGFGLDRGFHWYVDSWNPSLEGILRSWWLTKYMLTHLRRWFGVRGSPKISAAQVNGSVLSWLDRQESDRPFFAFLNLFDAHEPYYPPAPTGFAFGSPDARYWWDWTRPERLSEADLTDLRDTYDSCILHLDFRLGELLNELDRRGLLDNTLLVVTADHGEMLGEQRPDLLGHDTNLYYPALNVPLVFHFPKRFPGGLRPDAPVSLVDVAHTVLDIVDDGTPTEFSGASLLPFLRGAADPAAPVRPSLSQANPADWHEGKSAWPISRGPLFSLIDGDLQYIVNSAGDEELYDVRLDAWEHLDLSATPFGIGVLGEYRTRLRGLLDADGSR